jgi:iron complex transport system substrate-binding protein
MSATGAQPRVVTLIASATEIVAALGCERQLVGRSHECDYPPSVARLPMCSQPRIDVHGTSREIDERVKSSLHGGLSIYQVDVGKLQELRPDVIITQTQCEVCAVSLADVEAAVCTLLDSRPRIVSLEPNALADLWGDVRLVAEAIGAAERGEELIARLQARLAHIARRASRLPRRPTVACIEWIDPLMAGGNWMPELVEIAGGQNLFGVAGTHSPWMTWEELLAADPEVIVVLPCGWNIEKCRQEMPVLTSRAEWPRLQAVRNGRVFVTDGNQYFNRPGPRLVEAAEILAEILHPEEFQFGHAGTGWELFE